MLKLMIADGTEETRQALEALFRDQCVITSCGDGTTALELLQQFVPDVLVVDLMLPQTDGLSLLQHLRQWNMNTMVLAQTCIDSSYVMDCLHRLQVAYVVRKPCHIQALEVRIRDFLSQLQEAPPAAPTGDRWVADMLADLGFSPKLDGYDYLLSAIPLYLKDPSQAITKELYAAVGAQFHKEGTLVERSIRSAIDKAWRTGDCALWSKYFRCGPDGTVLRPSNGHFIIRMAQLLAGTMREAVG